MAVCHNVTPVEDAGQRQYQASSPDEVALVKFADQLHYKLLFRDQAILRVQTPLGEEDPYEILLLFPFTPASKRMGIIVKHQKTQRIIYFLKGAEQAIKDTVDADTASKMVEGAEDLSMEGLRTLCFVERLLPEQDYLRWRQDYDRACAAEQNREESKDAVRRHLEVSMDYLGVSGVEGTCCAKYL
jgi:phospholipid-translocating ATPase